MLDSKTRLFIFIKAETMEDVTLYEQFIHQMEKIGLRREFTILEEKDVSLSDDDSIIYVTANNCHTISIKGLKESIIRGRIVTHPYYISIKANTDGGKEALPEDTFQLSITEFKKSGLPTSPEIGSHIIFYNYPYSIASSKLRLKRGIIITKDRRLEIRIMRKNIPLKIAKFELRLECDKWFKVKNKSDTVEKIEKDGY